MRATLLQLVIGLSVILASATQAQLMDVQITAARQKLDEQKERASNATITTKEIIYKITVQNRTFKPIPELKVKYMIFYADPQPGEKGKPVDLSHRGAETLTNVEGNRTVTIDTKPFKLTTQELDAGWYYTSGADNRAKDKVTGVWIRAYAGDKIVGEYANPSTVSKKNDWKD